jgi:DNA invertase Pin-like site-specific DNA recombinase
VPLIGYARVSTEEQDLAPQLDAGVAETWGAHRVLEVRTAHWTKISASKHAVQFAA